MAGTDAWMGKLLRVDLSSGRVWEEESTPFAQEYIGGFGLGLRLAWDEIPPGVGAFDPENELMFLTGPLTGTTAPMSGRTTVCALGPQGHPHEWFIRGSMGGHFGPELKYAGYDGVIIQGKADGPVYLWINDGQAEIRDARHLWGKGTYATQEELVAELGSGVRVATIGQAGERLSRIAIINSETESAVGQGGFGAVMGAKKLKAIAVQGSGAVRVAKPEEFLRRSQVIAKEIAHFASPHRPGHIDSLAAAKYGTRFVGCSQQCSARCSRVHRRVPGVAHPDRFYSGQAFCVAGRLLAGGDLPFYRFRPGFEGGFEVANLASDLGINQWELIRAIMPYLVGCREQGLMKEVDGTPIDFDSPHFWEELLRKIAYREGMGDALAEGGRRGIELIGVGKHLIGEFYVGWGYPDHWDGHRPYGNRIVFPYWLVTYLQWAVANRDPMGSGHGYGQFVMAFSPIASRARGLSWEKLAQVGEKLYGTRAAIEPTSGYEAKAIPAVWHSTRSLLKDSLTVCDNAFPRIFSTASLDGFARADGMEGPDFEYHLFTAATGLDIPQEEFYRRSERVFNLDRAIQVRNFGRSRADDETVLPWFEKEEAFVNPVLGVKMRGEREKLQKLLTEYYQLRGWDPDTGRPTRAKLEELGLGFVAAELAGRGLI